MTYAVEIRTQQVVQYVVEVEVEADSEEAAIEKGWELLMRDQDRYGIGGHFENTYELARSEEGAK